MMPGSFACFDGRRRLANGPLHEAALAAKQALAANAAGPVLLFDNATGRSIDVDLRGDDAQIVARFAPAPDAPPAEAPEAEKRGRGRPSLGVVAREVTLLPRHWDWLAAQPGGASVALRKLVETEKRTQAARDQRRQAQERAYHFMSAMAGDLPGFEEASRALFASDTERFREMLAAWPGDISSHILELGGFEA